MKHAIGDAAVRHTLYVLSEIWPWCLAFIGVMLVLAWVVWHCVRRPDAGPVSVVVAFISAVGFTIAGVFLAFTCTYLFW